MKTRIKVLKMADDSIRYLPQYKGWFFWKSWLNYSEFPHEFPNKEQAITFIQKKLDERASATVIEKSIIQVHTK